jgi:hypothetical protein
MKMSRRRRHPNSGGGNQTGRMKLVTGVGHLNRRHRLPADVEPAELLPLFKPSEGHRRRIHAKPRQRTTRVIERLYLEPRTHPLEMQNSAAGEDT